MMNGLNSKNRGHFFGVILGLVALMTLFGFSSLYAGDLLVYTALEDDEVAIYLPAFKKAHPDINITLYRDSTGIVTAKLLAEKDNIQADVSSAGPRGGERGKGGRWCRQDMGTSFKIKGRRLQEFGSWNAECGKFDKRVRLQPSFWKLDYGGQARQIVKLSLDPQPAAMH